MPTEKIKRIRVLKNWGGKPTNERRVLPGEYDIDDPRLFGAGLIIVNEGAAIATVVVDEAPDKDADKPKDEAPDKSPSKSSRSSKK